METATREQWRRGGKVTPVKKKKEWKKFEIYECIESARCRFLTGGGENWIDGEGGGNSGVGPLHQFARDAAVYLTNDQILYAKKSTTGRGGMYSPSLRSRRECVYIYYIYVYTHLFPPSFEYISRGSHALASLVILVYPSGYIRMARGERKPTDDT